MIEKKGQEKTGLIVLVAIILILTSGITGYFLGQNSMKEYKIAVDELFPEQQEVFSVEGIIQKISENSFVIEIPSFERNLPGQEINFINITINLNQNTKIVGSEFLPDSEEVQIAFSDLIIGEYVAIESNENIKNKKEFTASKIIKLIETQEEIHE
jgi:uncharacterized protein (UPF0333 family)